MAITQERFRAVIEAAQSIYATYAAQCADLARQVEDYRAGRQQLSALLEWCAMRNVRPDALVASELIVLNREHFRMLANWAKNKQEAERLARRREEGGGGKRVRKEKLAKAVIAVQTVEAMEQADDDLDAAGDLGGFGEPAEPQAVPEIVVPEEHQMDRLTRNKVIKESEKLIDEVAVAELDKFFSSGKPPKDGS